MSRRPGVGVEEETEGVSTGTTESDGVDERTAV